LITEGLKFLAQKIFSIEKRVEKAESESKQQLGDKIQGLQTQI
jgi:tetrahydromethanopterin S-methyltransferase subunit G